MHGSSQKFHVTALQHDSIAAVAKVCKGMILSTQASILSHVKAGNNRKDTESSEGWPK